MEKTKVGGVIIALYSNTLAVIRQHLSSMVDDLIMGTADSGTTATLTDAELASPKWANDYFNEHGYKLYIYQGAGIEEESFVTDFSSTSTPVLTYAPAGTSPTTSSKYELHHVFWASEYLRAINMAIEAMADKYLIDIKDETTIKLTSTTDNLSGIVYTYEYSLPLSMLYIHKVITEEALNGVKLTGTVTGALTAGETVTGATSGATGELSYGPAGATYIRLRKVDGTFVVGENAEGASQACNTLTAVASEVAGGGRWLDKDIIDPRYYSVIKSYAPKLKLNKGSYSIEEDLYLRLEGQGAQPKVDDDTDVIYLPPDWLIAEAILNLPKSKILSGKLDNVYRQAEKDVLYYRLTARNWPHPKAKSVVE